MANASRSSRRTPKPFGFTVAECAANGIPYIAAHVGGIPEVADDDALNEQLLFAPMPQTWLTEFASFYGQRRRKSGGCDEASNVSSIRKPKTKRVTKYTQLLEQPVSAGASSHNPVCWPRRAPISRTAGWRIDDGPNSRRDRDPRCRDRATSICPSKKRKTVSWPCQIRPASRRWP